jgi:hypothetical protein
VQRGDLHRGQGDIAQRHRQEADTDAHPPRPGERRGRAGDATVEKAVLPQPQLIQSGVIRGARAAALVEAVAERRRPRSSSDHPGPCHPCGCAHLRVRIRRWRVGCRAAWCRHAA